MGRLIIIGNGYDLHHLKGATAYKEFGEWLCDKYSLSLENKNKLPFSKAIDVYTGNFYLNAICEFPTEVAEKIDDERNCFFAAMLVNMIQDLGNDTWNAFENDLAKLPWEKYIEEANTFFGSKSLCGSSVSYGTDFITSSVSTIYSLFSDWANTIDSTPLVKNSFQDKIKTINDDDTILIFNYTDTFERLFDLQSTDPRVLHIHGIAKEKDSIVVGHGDKQKSEFSVLDTVVDYIQDAETTLFKNTSAIIEKYKKTWEKIESDFSNGTCNEVWEYGWRGEDADEPYMEKIVQIVKNSNKDCTLFLNCHDCSGCEKKKLWKKNGFKGKILFFTDDE